LYSLYDLGKTWTARKLFGLFVPGCQNSQEVGLEASLFVSRPMYFLLA
jgi:hypothetical protein